MRLWRGAVIIVAAMSFIFLSLPLATAQEEISGDQITISKVEVDQFPIISVQVMATDENGQVISDLSQFVVLENDQEIEASGIELIDLGVSLVFVIDANETINETDVSDGPTRLEKTRDSIIRYANFFMDPLPNDEVSIIVPGGLDGKALDEVGMKYQNEVINAINFYQPDRFDEPPLTKMLEEAIKLVQGSEGDDGLRGVVLFTDGGQLEESLDYEAVISKAAAADVPIYGLLLGNRADAEEVAALQGLTTPTGGSFRHMPAVEDADELYQLVQDRSVAQQISYQSSVKSSGRQKVVVRTGDAEDQLEFDVAVNPPTVVMTVDNSRPIRRVGTSHNTPLDLMDPKVQPLVAQLGWPDNQPRKLVDARLLINGEEAPIEAPVLGDDGVLTFDWDLRQINEGLYDIQIEVTDELGLVGISKKLPLAVEIDIPPEPIPTPTAVPAPTAPPTQPALIIEPEEVEDNLALLGGGLFFLALFGFMALVFIVLFVRRTRRNEPAASSAGSAALIGSSGQPGTTAGSVHSSSPGQVDPNVTYIVPPDFAIAELGRAYIEVVEHAPEHATVIPAAGSNMALGRDPKVVQVPFNDRSVSRLHARIIENEGTYRIYDEGSSSGTYVNYERIGLAPRILNDNDDIHLGRVHLKFHLTPPEDEASDSNPPETEIYSGD